MGKIVVQIGAGAGDLDARAHFRDGFTEHVKRFDPNEIERIVLVEPNPNNIPSLMQCWKDYPQAEILPVGIRLSTMQERVQTFYYAEEDAPHFQVFSAVEAHVRKHYPSGTIRSVDVETITLPELMGGWLAGRYVDLLALDIEGLDAAIILDADWTKVNCGRISFEILHLGQHAEAVFRKLGYAGFMMIGVGLDVNGHDLMYENIRKPAGDEG